MEQLKYVIEDRTIAQLLGVQNFTNDESAILELVKNAYDAKASYIELQFSEKDIIIKDNGIGMDASDIKQHWMHVGKSFKEYDVVDDNNHKRVLAGSKGIGRFALARLGNNIQLFAKKENCKGIIWETDWNNSTLITDETMNQRGIKIVINELREKWTKKKIQGLISFLSKTYNDNVMSITVSHPDIHCDVPKYFSNPVLGRNCLSTIDISYDSKKQIILTKIISDEFTKDAQVYCPNINLQKFISETNMVDELKNNENLELSISELKKHLKELGDFSAQFYFNIKQTKLDAEKFLYKYCGLTETMPVGVILYRNAFSISAYEGNKDWLGFGKRSRKSPAAASHPSGAWRVRENQIAGKVTIDKQRNSVLQDLSNRQGLDENIYYQLFIKIILSGITEFERYRQNIIRNIDKKNKKSINKPTPVSNKVVSEPKAIFSFTEKEARQLANEIKLYKKENLETKREKTDVESRYKYDVRILNMLATVGLKASSIAHEMRNDRNSIENNTDSIIAALQEYGMWEELKSPEKTTKAYKNVPYLLDSNKTVSTKIVTFMNAMLSEIERKQFEPTWQSVSDILNKIKKGWERDYAWISIIIEMDDDICFLIAEDVLQVIFDNLILNSIQQNENSNNLNIKILVNLVNDLLFFSYSDDGKGLDKKYKDNPRKILEVHETTRKKGHGLGMWIVNNTLIMSGGKIEQIYGTSGFAIDFTVGGIV